MSQVATQNVFYLPFSESVILLVRQDIMCRGAVRGGLSLHKIRPMQPPFSCYVVRLRRSRPDYP